MLGYRRVLRAADFRRIWLGSTISTIGDGMTFVALSWLVLTGPGAAWRLGLLGLCYTAPVVLGGLAAGPLFDRFDRRTVLLIDCVFRACLMASIPVTAALNSLPGYLPFVAAAAYGLLKMFPLTGFPAAIPALVPEPDLDAANALESLSFSVAAIVGPAMAGVLIAVIGAPNVLAIDSASFLIFGIALTRVRRALGSQHHPTPTPETRSLLALARDRAIVATTIAFMAFNIAEGMLLVAAPWLVRSKLAGGATTLGFLLALTATGEIVGAALAGGVRSQRSPVRAIGVVQTLAAAGFLALLATANPLIVGAGFLLVGLLSAPMTVWAQSLRMRRIPAELHGRAFALLRTLMQGTLPLGSLLVTPFVVNDRIGLAAIVMTLIAGLPGVILYLCCDRVSCVAEKRGDDPVPHPAAGPSSQHPGSDRA
jgi:MFS family permease